MKERGTGATTDGWYIDDVTMETWEDIPPPPPTAISPSSGYYVTTQEFDLVLLVGASDCSGLNISATLNGDDVTSFLNGCLIPGTLSVGGESFKCPAVGQMLDPGYYTFEVTFDFDDCESATKTARWNILSNTEP